MKQKAEAALTIVKKISRTVIYNSYILCTHSISQDIPTSRSFILPYVYLAVWQCL